MKFWLERMGTDDVVAETMKESALAWLVFLTQLAIIIFVFLLLLTLIRYLRVFNKRRRALKDLKRAAKESNFYYRQVGNCYRSLFKNFDRPYVTLEREDVCYAIRFVPALRKNSILRFRSALVYRVNRQFGYILPNRSARMLAVAQIFRPDNIGDELLSFTYKEMHEMQKGDKLLPPLCLPDDGRVWREIVIFNPVPLRVIWSPDGRDRQLIGGETIDGVGYYDTFGFCSYLIRNG